MTSSQQIVESSFATSKPQLNLSMIKIDDEKLSHTNIFACLFNGHSIEKRGRPFEDFSKRAPEGHFYVLVKSQNHHTVDLLLPDWFL